MDIKLSRCYLKKILPKEKDNYSTYKEFYSVVSGNMKQYSKINMDENPKDMLTKELKKFIKNLYNLDSDKYNNIYMNSKFYLAFIFNNIKYINKALTKSKEPDYVLNNMLLVYNLQKSVAIGMVNTLINKTNSKILDKETGTMGVEVMMCKRSIRLRLLEQIRVDYLRNMNFGRKEDTVKAQHEIEKALLTFVNDDVLLDYYHYICSNENMQNAIKQALSDKKTDEIVKINKKADLSYALVTIREQNKKLKNLRYESN